MGMEAFGAFYTSETNAHFERVVDTFLRKGIIQQTYDKDRGELMGLVSREFPVEVQIRCIDTISTKLAFRFALINPPEIDGVFFDLVHWSCERWSGSVYLMSSALFESMIPSAAWAEKRNEIEMEIDFQRKKLFELCGGSYMKVGVSEAAGIMLQRLKARWPSDAY